jgi:hypothetical protein
VDGTNRCSDFAQHRQKRKSPWLGQPAHVGHITATADLRRNIETRSQNGSVAVVSADHLVINGSTDTIPMAG